MEGLQSDQRGRGCKGVEGGAKHRYARLFRRPYEITVKGTYDPRAAAFTLAVSAYPLIE